MVAQRLLEVFADEEAEVSEIARTIELDPGLSARVIGLASSAFFGARNGVYTVDDAIVRVLGLEMVKSLALSISLSGSFRTDACPRFDLRRYWATALLSASMARWLTPHIGIQDRPEPGQAYLAGLLHNLGLLVLVHAYPVQMNQVLRVASGAPEWTQGLVEQEYVGVDHHDAGSWLAHRWHLPREVMVVMEHHHEPEYRGPDWTTALLVGCCSRWMQWRLRSEDAEPEVDAILAKFRVPRGRILQLRERAEDEVERVLDLAAVLAGGA